jgi:uncharacterized protein (DUF2062 family)
MRQSLWNRRVIRPIVDLLRQGITPGKIALTIALGITLGVTPVPGSTALLCTLAAAVFGLNLAAIQLVNWMVYPLQLALLVPFLRVGAWMFGSPLAEVSVAHILDMIRGNVFQAIATLWTATMHAIVAWFLLGSATTAVLYLALLPAIHALWARTRAAAEADRC